MSDGEIRIGHEEREAAKRLLKEHFDAGRLDADEYEDRRGRAGDAVTRADLDGLFTDLPHPADRLPVENRSATPAATSEEVKDPWAARRGALMGLISFGAVALFFVTHQWQWFLLIPLAAMVWTLFTGRDK
ncbi:MAG: DUF1707 SHOCT-like domain-containing protein [Intrasporangium sp.]|uniref:DUF1707 SHOCT-like domain-containing protein n=1 Tax=Intrasporangium sp. TaxID=1925024 RepID=UPI003F82226E